MACISDCVGGSLTVRPSSWTPLLLADVPAMAALQQLHMAVGDFQQTGASRHIELMELAPLTNSPRERFVIAEMFTFDRHARASYLIPAAL